LVSEATREFPPFLGGWIVKDQMGSYAWAPDPVKMIHKLGKVQCNVTKLAEELNFSEDYLKALLLYGQSESLLLAYDYPILGTFKVQSMMLTLKTVNPFDWNSLRSSGYSDKFETYNPALGKRVAADVSRIQIMQAINVHYGLNESQVEGIESAINLTTRIGQVVFNSDLMETGKQLFNLQD
jgi:hypothetical protein